MTAEEGGSSGPTLGAGAALRQLVRYVLPYRTAAALLVVTMLIEVAYETALPLSLRFLIDEAIGPGNSQLMVTVLLVLSGGFLASTAAMVVRDYLYAWLMSHVLTDIRVRMFEHLQRLPLAFFARTRAGDLMSRFSTDLGAVENALVLGVPGALLSIFYVTASLGALLWIEWRLAVGLLVALPICLIGPRIFGSRAVTAGYALRNEQAGLANMVQENIGAQPVVKAFDLGDSALRGFRSQALRLLTFNVRFSFLSYLTERSPNIGMAAFNLLALALGTWLAVQGVLTVGSLVSFYALFVSVSASVLNLTSLATTLLQATSGMQRIEEVLGHAPSLVDKPGAVGLPRLSREIAFEGVTFSYTGERNNLSDVSLRIPAGERVAFVGPSGCGKSTALTMILRFYDPSRGRITIDGVDLRDAQRPSLYGQIGVVFQDNFMFNGTIRDNILLGRPEATQDEIEAAARDAELHDFIVKQPNGYDTMLGERGGGLSGGQRQRVAIARALIRNPALLILDEATSALDPVTESSVNDTLNRIARGRTLVSVTHRLATVSDYERICVFGEGRLVEQGTFQQLVAAGGAFAELWSKQSGFTVGDDGAAGVHADWLRRVALFEALPDDVLAQLAEEFVSEQHDTGRDVIVAGDVGDRFYITVRGKVEVSQPDATGAMTRIAVLQDGDHFGEVALLRNVPRTAAVRTLEPSTFLTLHKKKFAQLLRLHPALREAMEAVHARREATLETPVVAR